MSPAELVKATGLSADQTRRGIEWLRLKGMARVSDKETAVLRLGRNGLDARARGLPERRLLDLLSKGPLPIQDLSRDLAEVFGPAMGTARRNRWVKKNGDMIQIDAPPRDLPGEEIIRRIGDGTIARSAVSDIESLKLLMRRPGYIIQDNKKSRSVSLPDAAAANAPGDIEPDAIDVEAVAGDTYPARIHPLTETIREIREIFVTLGFSEIAGDLSQSSFWNFDALFTPQDHPAREMQDTFYIDSGDRRRHATRRQADAVASAHKKSWGGWDERESRRRVLRTHTTCVTIRHLAENNPDEARTFSLGRVFRNEKVSYKHLVEFHQVEGVVTGRGTTLRDLMGIQKEFYRRMGLEKVKFWPTFFPYTEPSLQSMVYNEKLKKWVELFGMGIFRPEVTEPLGIDGRVLAWGGGIERIAMMRYGVEDVREFYSNDLGWLRSVVRCR